MANDLLGNLHSCSHCHATKHRDRELNGPAPVPAYVVFVTRVERFIFETYLFLICLTLIQIKTAKIKFD